MTFKYYIKHLAWGLIGCGYPLYIMIMGLHDDSIYPPYIPFIPYIAAYLAISAIAFPFSFYMAERVIIKKTSGQTWDSHFSESSPSWSAFIFAYLLCIIFFIPLCLAYPFIKK
ncbi:hypothetical protein R2217_004321 [Cronobacter turicensis]|nr:hypothetical protein [Cronobacter turicensis]ELQ6078085.1 hypothetical protein [Cronobacter turicensis]ELQ6185286.1 hypothetical protein [Cronobacter turicensis]ELQ6234341.1 hypothetical protein [Cronobacter turicensis]ELQ6238874.1 hypothetical protein [Cronobacter turicensis]